MKVTLVQPPLLDSERESLNPPLGLLSLGAVLREESTDVEIIDFNLDGFHDPRLRDPAIFYELATERIARTGPDVVGFTSMALESHVGLELARLLKRQDPCVKTLFGGAHFSSIAKDVLGLYPWTDYVALGEAERPMMDLIRAIRGRRDPAGAVNVAWRRDGEVKLERRYRHNFPMDELPMPAHELVDVEKYFAVNKYRMLCIEHTRGCQLRCTFCYSEAHWGHGEQRKSPERVLEELERLAALGAHYAFFVGDNFLTHRTRAQELCEVVAGANIPIKWKCYATLAQLDPGTIDALARAKCNSVFIGVDAVSDVHKGLFRKSYFKGWEPLRATLDACMSRGVSPTCSFLVSPADTRDGIESTLRAALFTRMRGAIAYVNALSVYNGTSAHGERDDGRVTYSERKPALMFDTPQVNRSNEYARRHPELFPMHQALPDIDGGVEPYAFCHCAAVLIERHGGLLARHVLDHQGELFTLVERMTAVFARRFGCGRKVAGDEAHRELHDFLDAALLDRPGLRAVLRSESLMNEDQDLEDTSLSVVVDGWQRQCIVRPWRVLGFPFHPGERNALTPIPHRDGVDEYLVTGMDGMIRYERVDAALGEILRRLSRCVRTARRFAVDGDGFDRLRRLRVLLPASMATTRAVVLAQGQPPPPHAPGG